MASIFKAITPGAPPPTLGSEGDLYSDGFENKLYGPKTKAGWVLVIVANDGDKGDITVSGDGATWTIDPNTVSNTKLADVPTATFKGRATAGTGDPEDLTIAQASALLVAGATTQVQFNNAGVFGGDSGFTYPGLVSGSANPVINKAATANTASQQFQVGGSGRAKFGLIGDDRAKLQTSTDGATFVDVMVAGNSGGNAVVGIGSTTFPAALFGHTFQVGNYGSGSSSIGFSSGIMFGNTANDLIFSMGVAADGFIEFQGGATLTKFMRVGAAGVAIGNPAPTATAPLHVAGAIRITPVAVASLPSAVTVGMGAQHFVTNALAPVSGAIIAGGGAVPCPVYSDGTDWRRV